MTTMHLGTCHQNSRALTCFMSLATVTLAQNKAAEVKATLAQNQAKIRSCQQQARRQAKSLLQGGLSCAAVRRVLAVYAVSEWDLGLAVQAAQRLSSLATSDARFPTSVCADTLHRAWPGRFAAAIWWWPCTLGTCAEVCFSVPSRTWYVQMDKASEPFPRCGSIGRGSVWFSWEQVVWMHAMWAT